MKLKLTRRWASNVARMGAKSLSTGKSNRPLRTHRRRREDNIKKYILECELVLGS